MHALDIVVNHAKFEKKFKMEIACQYVRPYLEALGDFSEYVKLGDDVGTVVAFEFFGLDYILSDFVTLC